jgi:excisionase family DNA binding protein
MEEFIGTKEAAELLGLSPRVIHAALRKGEIKGRNLRGRRGWVTTKAALREWVENGNAETK